MITLKHEHPWHVTPSEAIQIQQRLAGLVRLEGSLAGVRAVAGLDVGLREGRARAAVVVLSYPDLERLGEATAERPIEFPYVPGLLTFREGPAALEALDRLTVPWDVLLCDGQGYAHPRRLGLASHLGVLLDCPSVGCAKSRLVGTPRCGDEAGVKHAATRLGPGEEDSIRMLRPCSDSHASPLPEEAGSWVELIDRGEVIGAVVRTRRATKPVYVSVGHRAGLADAIMLVLGCTRGRRLPEPARLAHQLASGGKP